MNKKSISILLFVVIAILTWLFKNGGTERPTNDDNGLVINRNPRELIFTKHARCRMDCRFFTEQEVRAILTNGTINNAKSNPTDKPCPSYAIEGITADGQHARMVFASCDAQTVKVVTCIDLEHQYQCSCN